MANFDGADAEVAPEATLFPDESYRGLHLRHSRLTQRIDDFCRNPSQSHLRDHLKHLLRSFLHDQNEVAMVRSCNDWVQVSDQNLDASKVYVEFISLQTGVISHTPRMILNQEEVYHLHWLLQGPSLAHTGNPFANYMYWDVIGTAANLQTRSIYAHDHIDDASAGVADQAWLARRLIGADDHSVRFCSGGHQAHGDCWDYEWLSVSSLEHGWIARVHGQVGLQDAVCTVYGLSTCEKLASCTCAFADQMCVLVHANTLFVCAGSVIDMMIVSIEGAPSVTHASRIHVENLMHHSCAHPPDFSAVPLAAHDGLLGSLCLRGSLRDPTQLKLYAYANVLESYPRAVLEPLRLAYFGSVALTSDKIVTLEFSLKQRYPVDAMEIVVRDANDPELMPLQLFTEQLPLPYDVPGIYCGSRLRERIYAFVTQSRTGNVIRRAVEEPIENAAAAAE